MDSVYLVNIERAVLSSILFDPEIFEDVLGVLKSQDFYLLAHQKIFDVMQELYRNDEPIDQNFIRSKLDKVEVDDSIFIEIVSSTAVSNTQAYIAQIKEQSVKRELARLSTTIQKITADDISASVAVDTVQNELYKISTDTASSELKNMIEVTTDTLKHLKKMKEMGTNYLIGETTGFESLDRKTTGFNGGDLIIVAARPAMGKTAFVLNTALRNIEENKGVIFFSLEMPAEQLMLRLFSIKSSIPLQDLRRGNLSDEQWSHLSSVVDDLSTKKFFVDDSGSVNINQLRARVRKLAIREENNISLVIVDYIGLMTSATNKDRHLEVQEISRGLKLLAREMNIPIIALSQLNRGLENRPDKRPMLSDLRESGAIEQDADIIMFVYRDDVYKERDEARKEKEAKDKGEEYRSKFINKPEEEAEIIIGKQRNGPIGTAKLTFQKQFTRFIDSSNNQSPPIEVRFQNTNTNIETKIDYSQNTQTETVDMPHNVV